jgi:hypothetical protein
MPPEDTDELSGQGADEGAAGTDESESLLEGEATSSETEQESSEQESSDDIVKRLQDQLSANGRELKDARERAQRAEGFATGVAARLEQTESRLESLGASLTAREKREMDAYLGSLPADQREREELRLKVDRLEARQSASDGAAREPTPDEQRQATFKRMVDIVGQAGADFGLDEGEVIQWNDSRLDTTSPQAYYASARRLARAVSLGKADATPPQPDQPTQWGGASTVMADNKTNVQRGAPGRSAPSSDDRMAKIAADAAKAAVKDFAKELGMQVGGAPHSARPATASANPFADLISDRKADPYQRALDGYKNTSGPRATRDKLKANLKEAEDRFGQLAR